MVAVNIVTLLERVELILHYDTRNREKHSVGISWHCKDKSWDAKNELWTFANGKIIFVGGKKKASKLFFPRCVLKAYVLKFYKEKYFW